MYRKCKQTLPWLLLKPWYVLQTVPKNSRVQKKNVPGNFPERVDKKRKKYRENVGPKRGPYRKNSKDRDAHETEFMGYPAEKKARGSQAGGFEKTAKN